MSVCVGDEWCSQRLHMGGKFVVIMFGKVTPALKRSYVIRRKMSLGSYTRLLHPLSPKIL